MADSNIGALDPAEIPLSDIEQTTVLGDTDMLLLEQNSEPRKIMGSDLKQYFNANVVSASASAVDPSDPPAATYNQYNNSLHLDLPAADYIVSITRTGRSGLVDTYTVTTALGYTDTFEVTNGGGSLASEIPLADVPGGAVGTSQKAAREDHKHPLVYPSADNVQALALGGTQYLVNPVDDVSNYATGFALFHNTTSQPVGNFPYTQSETQWALVISGKADGGTVFQVAFDLSMGAPPRNRRCASGVWNEWSNLCISAYALLGQVPVANGGTGASTASAALANLGITDSGWIEVTFASGFRNYGTTNKCQYRKFGNIVTICGAATPTSDIAGSNTQYTMFTMPAGFRPKVFFSTIAQGSGTCRWQMQVGSGNGAVTFSRYANENGLQTAAGANGDTPGAWLVFSATYLTA